jgi:hypothetical protein
MGRTTRGLDAGADHCPAAGCVWSARPESEDHRGLPVGLRRRRRQRLPAGEGLPGRRRRPPYDAARSHRDRRRAQLGLETRAGEQGAGERCAIGLLRGRARTGGSGQRHGLAADHDRPAAPGRPRAGLRRRIHLRGDRRWYAPGGSPRPHAWMELHDPRAISSSNGLGHASTGSGRIRRVSTIDLFDGSFTLITGWDAQPWRAAAAELAETGVPISVLSLGAELTDPYGELASRYHLADRGCVLVRPDGYVTWACDGAPERAGDRLRDVVRLAAGHRIADLVR